MADATAGATTPRYPTSGELAAFRRTIPWRGRPEPDPLWPSANVGAYGGAWPRERRDGIGYHPSPGLAHIDAALQGFTRREAAAMRSRAFAKAAA